MCPIQVEFKFDSSETIFDNKAMPLELKKWEIHFQIIISTAVGHVQLKFNIWMCRMRTNIQIKFKYTFGQIIFLRVMPLN